MCAIPNFRDWQKDNHLIRGRERFRSRRTTTVGAGEPERVSHIHMIFRGRSFSPALGCRAVLLGLEPSFRPRRSSNAGGGSPR